MKNNLFLFPTKWITSCTTLILPGHPYLNHFELYVHCTARESAQNDSDYAAQIFIANPGTQCPPFNNIDQRLSLAQVLLCPR